MAKITAIFSTVLVVLVFSVIVSAYEYYSANCTMGPPWILGNNVSGTIYLTQPINGSTTLTGQLSGFNTSGNHGFHVHQFGNLSNACVAAGAHYNPFNKSHGAQNDTIDNRHVGDLGNIYVDPNNETAIINIVDDIIQLYGNYSIIGRSLVVHAMEDDLGKGGANDSNTTGHSGSRIGCCVITFVGEFNSTTPATNTSTTPNISETTASLTLGPFSSTTPAITASTTPTMSGATASLILGPFTAAFALSCSFIHLILNAVRNSMRL